MKWPRLFITTLLYLLPFAAFAHGQQVVPHRWIARPGNMMGTWVTESPNGRFVLLQGSRADSLFLIEKSTKKRIALDVRGGNAVFSPAGDRIAFHLQEEQGKDHIWVVPIDAATGRLTGAAQRVTVETPSRWPSFSPDGKSIVFQRAGKILSVPATGGEERVIVSEPNLAAGRPFVTPDGKWVYFRGAEPRGTVWIRRAPASGGKSQRVVEGAHPLGISPSGKYIAYYPTILPYQSDDATIAIATLDGKEVSRAFMPVGSYWGMWAPGDRFVFAAIEVPAGINRIQLSDGSLTELTPANSYDRQPAYSPDGKTISVRRTIDGVSRLVLLRADGKNPRILKTSPVLDQDIEWSPDGRHIAYLTIPRRLAVVDVTTGEESILASGLGLTSARARLAWRSDGKAVRYIYTRDPQYREIREATLDRKVTTLLRVDSAEIPAHMFFLDDANIIMARPGRITTKPLRGGAERTVYEGQAAVADGIAMSPDKKWLGIPIKHSSGGETIAVVSAQGGEARVLPFVQPCGISARDWHPDGRHLLLSSAPNCGDRFDLFMVPVDGGVARNLTSVDKRAVDTNTYAVSPDGKYMIYDSEEGWYTRIGEIDVRALVK